MESRVAGGRVGDDPVAGVDATQHHALDDFMETPCWEWRRKRPWPCWTAGADGGISCSTYLRGDLSLYNECMGDREPAGVMTPLWRVEEKREQPLPDWWKTPQGPECGS